MDGPQIENGYTRIANELLEAIIRFPLRGEQQRVFLAIIRKTYGYSKKEDLISISQLVAMTGMPDRSVRRALDDLEKMRIINMRANAHPKPKTIGVQKNYSLWRVCAPTRNMRKTTQEYAHGRADQYAHGRATQKKIKEKTKDIHDDEIDWEPIEAEEIADTQAVNTILQKLSSTTFTDGSPELDLAKHYYTTLKQNGLVNTAPDLQAWAKYIHIMQHRDGWKPERIGSVMKWIHEKDDFWRTRILSTQKLREACRDYHPMLMEIFLSPGVREALEQKVREKYTLPESESVRIVPAKIRQWLKTGDIPEPDGLQLALKGVDD